MAVSKVNYIISGDLTEDAILDNDLLNAIGVKVVGNRELPKDGTLRLKDPEHFDYHNRGIRFHYPGSGDNNGLVVPDAAIYNEILDHFGNEGVYVGIPIWIRDGLLKKLKSQGINAITEEVGVVDDEKYWWMKKGFKIPKQDEEYITMEDLENEGGEVAYGTWKEFFIENPKPVLANTTCTFSLSCQTPVGSGVTGKEVWKLSCSPQVFNVVDVANVQKPKSNIVPRRIPGKRDKMRSGLKALRSMAAKS